METADAKHYVLQSIVGLRPCNALLTGGGQYNRRNLRIVNASDSPNLCYFSLVIPSITSLETSRSNTEAAGEQDLYAVSKETAWTAS